MISTSVKVKVIYIVPLFFSSDKSDIGKTACTIQWRKHIARSEGSYRDNMRNRK